MQQVQGGLGQPRQFYHLYGIRDIRVALVVAPVYMAAVPRPDDVIQVVGVFPYLLLREGPIVVSFSVEGFTFAGVGRALYLVTLKIGEHSNLLNYY